MNRILEDRWHSGGVTCAECSGSLYAEPPVSIAAVNVRDGRLRNWQNEVVSYDLTFSGCSMTVQEIDWFYDWEKISLPEWEPQTTRVEARWKLTHDLSHYDPNVAVAEDVTKNDLYDDSAQRIILPKGARYFIDGALVSTIKLSRYEHDYPRIDFDLSYPFAGRFAKALQHAITLCGGKPEAF